MIDVVTHENRPLYLTQLEQMWRQRYEVFIDKFGWDLPAKGDPDRREIDQFDTARTIYLLTCDDDGDVRASVRLNPTEAPHLMSEIFPGLCAAGVPRAEDIWEISRGYIVREGISPEKRDRFGLAQMCAAVELGLLYGVNALVLQCDTWMLPAMLQVGLDIQPLGLPAEMPDGSTAVAGSISVTATGLQNLRQLHHLELPLIRIQPLRHAA